MSSIKHEQVRRELLDRIRSGVLAEGAPLPSEAQLCAEFGASRGTVRQALSALRADGVIAGGRGAPPVVRRLVPKQSFATFMSFTEWATSLGLEPGQRTVEVVRRACPEEIALELELEPADQVVQYTRLRTIDGRPAMLERSTFPFAVGSCLLLADLDTRSVYRTLIEAGRRPDRARHVIDAVAANPLDAELLEVEPGTPLLRQRRVVHDADGAPFEWADDRYLPSEARFVIENTIDAPTPLTLRRTDRKEQE